MKVSLYTVWSLCCNKADAIIACKKQVTDLVFLDYTILNVKFIS